MPNALRNPLAYLKEHQNRFVDELSEYLRFPSVSAQARHRKDLNRCADWLLRHCSGLGLDSRLLPTRGNPVLIARTPNWSDTKPHYLVYGHYDVQPPEPLELWKTPPFEPTIRNGSLFARGASDNKGQHFAHLKAVEAFLKTKTPLPCNITFLVEGEEEVGSDNIGPFLKQHRKQLRCDGVVVSDNGIPSLKHPALTYALRGIAALQIELHGPNRDLHSGLYGGSVDNPAMALCQLLAQLRDRRGRVNVPGFYDDVLPLSAEERKQLKRVPYQEAAYRKSLGVPDLFGEKGYTPYEQRAARPTLEINGLTSGYQDEGSKTIVPAWARAKLTCRLVPNQQPRQTLKLVEQHLRKLCPSTVRMRLVSGHGGEPYLVSPKSPQAQAALRALRSAFQCTPLLLREGGSIPIVSQFKRYLGADTLLLGLALPDDNLHSPNEKFSLRSLELGSRLGVHLWEELAR